jgi:peptidoglycan/LPS O-acetylase OafA/YrhL
MGTLRFILASLVLVSHLQISIAGLNPGVVAVVMFYLLAGQVVCTLLWKWRERGDRVWAFYTDRFWRIAPQYVFALAVAASLWLLGAQSTFLAASPAVGDWAANLAVVPLSYYMFTGQDSFTLIPPSWSLGVELQFYLLAPLLMSTRRWLWIVTVSSLALFSLAQTQWLDTDWFGYRLLPGVLFIFLLGPVLAGPGRRPQPALPLWFAAFLWVALAIYAGWLYESGRHAPWDREVAVGLLIGLPLLALLLRMRRSETLAWRVDRALGGLSYGVFLFHFPALWMFELSGLSITPGQQVMGVGALSVMLAAIGHWGVERPLWRRYRPFEPEPSSARPIRAGIA